MGSIVTLDRSLGCFVLLLLGFYLSLFSQRAFADFSISNSEEGRSVIEKLSNDERLRLSLDGLEKRFSFVISIGRTVEGATEFQAHYYVIRDEESVAVVMLSKDGSPYGYSRQGLCALLGSEAERPLLLTEGGAPKVVLQLKEMGKNLVFELLFSSRLKEPDVVVDIPSILAEAVKNPSRIEYDKAGKRVMLDTEHHALMTLTLSDSNSQGFLLKEMAIQAPSGITTVISNISLLPENPHIARVDRGRFEALNIPKQKVPKGAVLLVPPFPPDKFGELPGDALVIGELRKILSGLPSEKVLPDGKHLRERGKLLRVPKKHERRIAVT